MSNGQTTATTGRDSMTTDPTRLTTEALNREITVINQAMDLRFAFYDRLLAESDKQRIEQKQDTKAAVDAALAAAKEAVKEQNISTEKAIGKTESLFGASIDGLKTDILDLKKYRDQASGKQTATVVVLGAVFALISLGLRFL